MVICDAVGPLRASDKFSFGRFLSLNKKSSLARVYSRYPSLENQQKREPRDPADEEAV